MPGERAEWSSAAVLKTVELRGSGGSNPSLSATKKNFRQTTAYGGRLFFVSTAAQVCLRKAVGTKERRTRSVVENFSLSIKDLKER